MTLKPSTLAGQPVRTVVSEEEYADQQAAQREIIERHNEQILSQHTAGTAVIDNGVHPAALNNTAATQDSMFFGTAAPIQPYDHLENYRFELIKAMIQASYELSVIQEELPKLMVLINHT